MTDRKLSHSQSEYVISRDFLLINLQDTKRFFVFIVSMKTLEYRYRFSGSLNKRNNCLLKYMKYWLIIQEGPTVGKQVA